MNHQLDQEVVAGFISEAKGYLPEIMLGLESFAADATQLHSLKEAFRYAHIIKGAASMLGFLQISEVAYQLEVTLEMLCEEHLPLSQNLLEDLCQNVVELAELLDQSFATASVEVPTMMIEEPSHSEALLLAEQTTPDHSLPVLPTPESLVSEFSLPENVVPDLSIPALLSPEQFTTDAVIPALTTLPLDEAPLPEFSLPPLEPKEHGETILLSSTEIEDDILPEAKSAWSSLTPTELAAIETEEPLVALLNDTNFSISLPETTGTPTIGDLDLSDVAKELKESFGNYPPPLQPEFALPDELMAGLPELRFPSPIEAPAEEALEAGGVFAKTSTTPKPADWEKVAEQQADILENSEPDSEPNLAFDNLADQLAEDLLAEPTPMPEAVTMAALPKEIKPTATAINSIEGDTFIIESTDGAVLATSNVREEITPITPETSEEVFAPPTFDEAMPELLALPNLPELSEAMDVAEPTALELPQLPELSESADVSQLVESPSFDASTTPDESVVEPTLEAATEASLPSPLSSPMISDEMANELMETFLLEAEEHLQNLHTSLRVLYKNPNNRDLIQEVRRSSHSLKGTAAMVGLDNIMQLAHRMEDVLDLIYDGEMQLTQERTLLLMQATDALEDMSNGQSNAGEVQRLYHEFAHLLSNHASAPATTEEPAEPVATESEAESAEAILEEPLESVAIAEPVRVEEAGLIGLPSVFADEADPVETESLLEAVTTGESLLPEWQPEVEESSAPESVIEAPSEPESTLLEPVIETVAEMADAPHPISEAPVEIASEPTVEITEEPPIEPVSFAEPAITAAPAAEPLATVPMAIAEPAPTPVPAVTTVYEPEVLPATPANAIAQASSQFVRVPIERLDDVVKLISEMIITRTTFEQRLADFARQVEELQITGTRLRRASSNLESKYEASTLGGGRASLVPNNIPPGLSASAALAASGLVNSLVTHHTHGFDDLEFDRYTEFHLVSRELVESSSDIQTLGRELNHLNSDFLSYLNRQGRIYSDLQDRLMRMRMVPLASIEPRLHRTVRTVAAQQHKEVELILEGETTAIDTTALQEMTDPLLHLLRNAVDHGLEAPDARIAKGKSRSGKITLRAFYEGSQVVIQLRDDGQGLDLNKIRNRALQQALITSAEAETMSPQELWALIFTPGFSTAPQVSEISGRGVGMDVVQTTVQRLKGTIIIDSQPDAGTTFTIRLPLTLAVTRSLMVKSCGQTFAIPLDVVTQILRLEMSKVERIGKEPVIRLGGKIYPLLMLSRLLNMRQSSDELAPRPPALLLSVEGKEVVVIVDQLMGGREVVIKTLGNHLRKIHGVMGATLMGDGEVVLILNLAELMRGTVRLLPRHAAAGTNPIPPTTDELPPNESSAPENSTPKPKAINETLSVMIVDDSPSVRRVSSNMIKNIGWIPTLAKDGLDALEQLQASEMPPDLILLDIEMPRMDGYQFLSSVRSLPAYRNLPVVIVSSRSSEKHRQKAFDLGATQYLVKPYQEENVVTLIRQLVKERH
ncbi:MAG: Hpt domain-containing protein [Blastocatellia bacterium]|nr:Hpt domain-containing protein [Blastocatellia bacterium]